jgi:hypothetical protein
VKRGVRGGSVGKERETGWVTARALRGEREKHSSQSNEHHIVRRWALLGVCVRRHCQTDTRVSGQTRWKGDSISSATLLGGTVPGALEGDRKPGGSGGSVPEGSWPEALASEEHNEGSSEEPLGSSWGRGARCHDCVGDSCGGDSCPARRCPAWWPPGMPSSSWTSSRAVGRSAGLGWMQRLMRSSTS